MISAAMLASSVSRMIAALREIGDPGCTSRANLHTA
jgi:hypothetical protein